MNILHMHPRPGQGVYVFEFPVRIWHWTMVLAVFTLFVTGHFIGKPLHTLSGDATEASLAHAREMLGAVKGAQGE